MAGQLPSKVYKEAYAQMQRWGFKQPYLLAAVQDAVDAAFEAKKEIDRTELELHNGLVVLAQYDACPCGNRVNTAVATICSECDRRVC